MLAASGNSPFLLGRRLWEETRVPLFEQSSDDRPEWARLAGTPCRVSFGTGWVRDGALELFQESVQLFPALLPVLAPLSPLRELGDGAMPALEELRLHHGTVWRWNRAVYDPASGGHLRIELRALPAGPTLLDMLANAAMLLGLTLRLSADVDRLLPSMPFEHARRNFYAAARNGLDAELFWPAAQAPSPRAIPARELIQTLLPLAREGLIDAHVDPGEVDALLGIFAARVERGMTGARWQTET
ncbi:MAG: glutamate--cysteine ligase, partial [Myxococcales bacterium]